MTRTQYCFLVLTGTNDFKVKIGSTNKSMVVNLLGQCYTLKTLNYNTRLYNLPRVNIGVAGLDDVVIPDVLSRLYVLHETVSSSPASVHISGRSLCLILNVHR